MRQASKEHTKKMQQLAAEHTSALAAKDQAMQDQASAMAQREADHEAEMSTFKEKMEAELLEARTPPPSDEKAIQCDTITVRLLFDESHRHNRGDNASRIVISTWLLLLGVSGKSEGGKHASGHIGRLNQGADYGKYVCNAMYLVSRLKSVCSLHNVRFSGMLSKGRRTFTLVGTPTMRR